MLEAQRHNKVETEKKKTEERTERNQWKRVMEQLQEDKDLLWTSVQKLKEEVRHLKDLLTQKDQELSRLGQGREAVSQLEPSDLRSRTKAAPIKKKRRVDFSQQLPEEVQRLEAGEKKEALQKLEEELLQLRVSSHQRCPDAFQEKPTTASLCSGDLKGGEHGVEAFLE